MLDFERIFNPFLHMPDAPQLKDITIEDLVPHRGRMRLVADILDVDGEMAVTGTTVTDRWPLLDGDGVNPLVVIEPEPGG